MLRIVVVRPYLDPITLRYQNNGMSSVSILFTYLGLFLLTLIVELFLDFLNIKYVKANSAKIPAEFEGHIDQATYVNSINYTLTKAKFGIASLLYSSVLLLAVVLLGGFGWFDNLAGRLASGIYWQGVIFVLMVSFFFSIMGLPFGWYSTFVIEEKFGFNKTTFRLWCADFVKGLAISIVLMVPLLCGLFWFMQTSGRFWWVFAFAFCAIFQLAVIYIYPTFIAPLFNKFSPLDDGALKTAILALAEKLGFRTSGIFVMDGSKRSGHGNAYFTGLGRNKRVVLFDTLIQALTEKELLAVLAHEIGHEKKQHIKKSLAVSLFIMAIGFYLLSLLIGYEPFYAAFGFKKMSYHAALVIFAFASSPISFFLSPVMNILSRRFEYQADRFSVTALGESDSLANGLIALSRKSLANLTPHPWYSFFHYSHPTLLERIQKMQSKEALNS